MPADPDVAELRRLAEEAGKNGPWVWRGEDTDIVGLRSVSLARLRLDRSCAWGGCIVTLDDGADLGLSINACQPCASKWHRWHDHFLGGHEDARYLNAASPDVVLALLDERQALLGRIAELEAELAENDFDPADLVIPRTPPLKVTHYRMVPVEDPAAPAGEQPDLEAWRRKQVAFTDDDPGELSPAGEQPRSAPAVPNRWRPAWAVHPGEILQEEITERGMTQAALAREIGCSAKHVNEICRGHVRVEAPFALRLEKALGISAELWLGLQAAWDLHQLRAGSAPADTQEAP